MSLDIQSKTVHGGNFDSNPINNSISSNVSFQDDQGSSFTYSQGQSIAEQTLQRYGPDNNSPTQHQSDSKIDTREHPVMGLQHPFDNEKKSFSSRI